MTKSEEIIGLNEKVKDLEKALKASEDEVDDLNYEISDLEDSLTDHENNSDKAERYDENEALIYKLSESKIDINNLMTSMKLDWILDNWDSIFFDLREGCSVNKS